MWGWVWRASETKEVLYCSPARVSFLQGTFRHIGISKKSLANSRKSPTMGFCGAVCLLLSTHLMEVDRREPKQR